MKIVLCGPPHSGKSVMREGLKQAIRQLPDAPYPYVITACPDGEGSWFQESSARNPKLASELKKNYKGSFSPGFVRRIAESVRNCNLPLTLIDIGGKITKENREICDGADHAIILYGNPAKLQEWRDFCKNLSLTIIAEIFSDYRGKEDSLSSQKNLFRGSVHYLERGEDVSQRPCIKALARHILSLL